MTKQNKMLKLIYRSLLFALPTLAFAVPLGWVATPYFEFFNGMAVQPKAKAQGTFGWGLADSHDLPTLNSAEWEPVPGTMPRDYVPHPYAGADPKAEDYQNIIDQAGRELPNLVPRNMENLKRGQELYGTFCYVCHGPLGIGDGPVVGAGRFPAPTSLQDDLVLNYPDGSIYQVITAGKGKMPGYGDKIKPEDRWLVIHYVRALQLAQNPESLEKAEP